MFWNLFDFFLVHFLVKVVGLKSLTKKNFSPQSRVTANKNIARIKHIHKTKQMKTDDSAHILLTSDAAYFVLYDNDEDDDY